MAKRLTLGWWLTALGAAGALYACSGNADIVLQPPGLSGGRIGSGGSGNGNAGGSKGGGTGGTMIGVGGGSNGSGGKGGSGKGGTSNGSGGDAGDFGSGAFGGFPDIDFTYDEGGMGQGGACAAVTGTATLVKRPMDIVISIDNSGSMAGEISAVIDRINVDFAQIIEASGIDYRVIMVTRYGNLNFTIGETNYSVCIGPPLGNTLCPAAPAPQLVNKPPHFFHHSTDIGSHNIWCRLLASYTTADEYPPPSRNGWQPLANCVGDTDPNCVPGWRWWLRSNAFKVFIGITDDNPATNNPGDNQNCRSTAGGVNDPGGLTNNLSGAQAFDRALRTLGPTQFGAYDAGNPDMGRNYAWYSIVGMTPKAAPDTTVPFQPTEPVVTTVCQGPVGGPGGDDDGVGAGQGYQELSRMTGGLRYSNCLNDDFDAIFNAIAQGIIEGARASCEYDVPVPSGGILDPQQTTVSYLPGGDPNQATLLPRAASDVACGANSGFYYSTALDKIFLCPATCTTVQADANAKVALDFGCLGS